MLASQVAGASSCLEENQEKRPLPNIVRGVESAEGETGVRERSIVRGSRIFYSDRLRRDSGDAWDHGAASVNYAVVGNYRELHTVNTACC